MRADGQTRKRLIIAYSCFPNVSHKHVLLKTIRHSQRNQESVVGVVTRPRVRLSGVRTSEGAKFSLPQISTISTLRSNQAPIQCVPGFFHGSKAGYELTIRVNLELKLRKSGAILPHSPYDTMQWTGKFFIKYT
jgi:hypothetical protein